MKLEYDPEMVDVNAIRFHIYNNCIIIRTVNSVIRIDRPKCQIIDHTVYETDDLI